MIKIRQSRGLTGEITVSGSKNAALPLLAANYLLDNAVTLTNVPDILDVHHLQEVMKVAKADSTSYFDLTNELVKKIRVSILLIPYGLRNFGKVLCGGTGGCKLGKRSLDVFDNGFEQAGVRVTEGDDCKVYEVIGTPARVITLSELSVTTTEALVTYLAFHPEIEEVKLRQIAIEPHVINLIEFLNNAGANITLHFDHAVTIKKASVQIKEPTRKVIGDYLEVGLFMCIGALAEGSEITITGCNLSDLVAPIHALDTIGVDYSLLDHQTIRVSSRNKADYQALKKLESRTYPGFPTDIQPQFTVLLTQCQGTSMIFETLFEGRFAYLSELQNLGAKIEILNPHKALITGPTQLKGCYVVSSDIRAGGAMMVAGIIATGETIITNEEMIKRGYENIVEKFTSLGVDINLES